jgi:hypothetical protein
MQTQLQERADQPAQVAQAEVGSLGTEVLSNALILSQLWGQLCVDDKKILRRACRLVRSQADSAVTVLDMAGATDKAVAAALARFPCVDCVTMPCRLECLLVLGATQQMPRLQKLSLRYEVGAPCMRAMHAHALGGRIQCTHARVQ